METDYVDEYKAMLTVDSVDESSLRRPGPEEVDATEHLQVVLVAVQDSTWQDADLTLESKLLLKALDSSKEQVGTKLTVLRL